MHLRTILILSAVLLIVYWPCLNGAFLFDDKGQIDGKTEGLRRLVTHETYAMDHWISGEPFQYHLTSLLIHGINVMLVYAILQALIPETAFWGALVFAVHPIFGETVQYIAARSSSLSALWVWAGMASLLYLRRWYRVIAIVACVVLAALSKEEGYLAIPLIFALWALRARKPFVLPLALALLVAPDLLKHLHSSLPILTPMVASGVWRFIPDITLWEHIQATLNNFSWHLIPNLILPIGLTGEPPIEYGNLIQFGVSVAVLQLLILGVLWKRIDYRYRFGVALLLLSSPLSRLILTMGDAAFEYRAYMCGLGFALLFAMLLRHLPVYYRPGFAMSLAAMLIVVTINRHPAWASPVDFWEDATAHHLSVRGMADLSIAYNDAGRNRDAFQVLLTAVKRFPHQAILESNLAGFYLTYRAYPIAALWLDAALHDDPTLPEAWTNYTSLLIDTGRREEARVVGAKALVLSPDMEANQINVYLANGGMLR